MGETEMQNTIEPTEPAGMTETTLAPYVAAVERAVNELRARAALPPKPSGQITVAELVERTGEHSLENLADLGEVMTTRIVRRAKYDALKHMLHVLDGWIEGARENHEALGHRGESPGDECWNRFAPRDIRRMVNDCAREVGTSEPWREPAIEHQVMPDD